MNKIYDLSDVKNLLKKKNLKIFLPIFCFFMREYSVIVFSKTFRTLNRYKKWHFTSGCPIISVNQIIVVGQGNNEIWFNLTFNEVSRL